MKKIFIFSALVFLAVTGCRKQPNSVSTEVSVSYPTISFAGGNIYFSIPVGGALPNVSATAYDSFYQERDSVLIDKSSLDNTTPGLYIVTASSKNKYGMTAYASIYVAVTNIPSVINLGGRYARTSNNDTVHVTKLATGLYVTDNVGGVLASNPAFILPAYFVQVDDTTIILPNQQTAQGAIFGTMAACNMSPLDTTYQYVVNPNPPFGSSLRVFLKL